MKNFFEKNEKIFNLKSMDRDLLLYRVMPRFVLEIIRKYFRLKVEGDGSDARWIEELDPPHA